MAALPGYQQGRGNLGASSLDPIVKPDAIPWLLLEVVGAAQVLLGGPGSRGPFIPTDTHPGGRAPTAGCDDQAPNVGEKAWCLIELLPVLRANPLTCPGGRGLLRTAAPRRRLRSSCSSPERRNAVGSRRRSLEALEQRCIARRCRRSSSMPVSSSTRSRWVHPLGPGGRDDQRHRAGRDPVRHDPGRHADQPPSAASASSRARSSMRAPGRQPDRRLGDILQQPREDRDHPRRQPDRGRRSHHRRAHRPDRRALRRYHADRPRG